MLFSRGIRKTSLKEVQLEYLFRGTREPSSEIYEPIIVTNQVKLLNLWLRIIHLSHILILLVNDLNY